MSPVRGGQDYNWHPAVHRLFGEELRFYLIRLREPRHIRVTEQIRSVLSLVDIPFACEYSVFGTFDALVRVWLTRVAEPRFIRAFSDRSNNIAEARYFQPSTIQYLWNDSDVDLLAGDRAISVAIAERRDDIDIAARDLDGCPHDVRERLLEAGLLIRRPINDDGEVKFYVALTRYGGDMARDVETQHVLAALDKTGRRDQSSLYSSWGRSPTT